MMFIDVPTITVFLRGLQYETLCHPIKGGIEWDAAHQYPEDDVVD